MDYRQLGRSDLKVSSIGLGAVTFSREIDEATVFPIMDHALERGINLIDTAEAYNKGGSESVEIQGRYTSHVSWAGNFEAVYSLRAVALRKTANEELDVYFDGEDNVDLSVYCSLIYDAVGLGFAPA